MGLVSSANDPLLSLELSRTVKENHASKIIKIAVPIPDSSFPTLVAILSANQVQHCKIVNSF